MFRLKSIVTFGLLLVLPLGLLHAQRWLEMWKDPQGHTFYDIQKAFNEYFETHEPGKGTSFNQFKRWEYYMEPRVGAEGKIMNPQVKTFNNYLEYVQENSFNDPGQRTASLNGDWTFFGAQDHIKGNQGYNGGIGRINIVAFHPTNSAIIYAGAPAGGLWKSTNTGSTWTPLTDGIDFWGVSGIVIDPTNTDIIYILTGDGDGSSSRSAGVWKSLNGGSTWSPTGLSINFETSTTDGYKLLMDPTNSNTLYAVMTNGLHKSTDAGATWTVIRTGSYRDMEFKPGDANTLYLSSTNTIYRSNNAGTTWTTVTTISGANRIALGVTPANSSYVYALCGPSTGTGSFKGVYRSTNSGVSFSLRGTTPNILGYSNTGNDNNNQSSYDLALAVHPTNAEQIFTGGINVWTSTNGGTSFSIQSYWIEGSAGFQYTHADIHELVFDGNVLYCGSDGGVYRTTNYGVNWNDISSGLAITELYRFGGTPQNTGLYVGGAQDNGSNKWTSPIPDLVMEHIDGADGMEAAVDPSNTNTLFTTRQFGSLWRSTNGGTTHSNIKPTILGSGPWVTPFILNQANPSTIIAMYNDVGVSYSQGSPTSSWINLSSGAVTGGTSKCLAIAPSDTNTIYAVKSSAVWKTNNFGTTWTNITTGLPGGTYSYIAVDPNDANRIYVTRQSWTANNKIWRSTNGGTTWTNFSGASLPNVPANCVTVDGSSDHGVYLGTDAGVYYYDDGQADWVDFSNGLPFCRVMEMEINPLANQLRAATYGRSIWESDLYGGCPSDLTLSGPLSGTQVITASNTITSTNSILTGADITFSAGTSITLNPGFTQALGSEFHAVMSGCSPKQADGISGTYEPAQAAEDNGVTVALEGYEITNYPNPYRHHTWISYKLPEASPVKIEVYNSNAQLVSLLVDGAMKGAGTHSVFFEGEHLAAGQYYVRFTAGAHTSFLKLSQLR